MAQRCVRYKRVRTRSGRTVRRCAKFSGRASNGRRRRSRRGYRRSRAPGMARRGSKCRRYKRVRVRGQGIARRCASYGGGRRRGYRKGRRPFNKGKKCVSWGSRFTLKSGEKRYCRSFGASPAWRLRKKRRPGTSIVHVPSVYHQGSRGYAAGARSWMSMPRLGPGL
jgi:hypothetical protein